MWPGFPVVPGSEEVCWQHEQIPAQGRLVAVCARGHPSAEVEGAASGRHPIAGPGLRCYGAAGAGWREWCLAGKAGKGTLYL